MNEYLYIVIDRKNNDKHLSYHKTQRSAYIEVARLANIPYTMRNFNKIGSKGGWKSKEFDFFVLEKDLLDNKSDYVTDDSVDKQKEGWIF